MTEVTCRTCGWPDVVVAFRTFEGKPERQEVIVCTCDAVCEASNPEGPSITDPDGPDYEIHWVPALEVDVGYVLLGMAYPVITADHTCEHWDPNQDRRAQRYEHCKPIGWPQEESDE